MKQFKYFLLSLVLLIPALAQSQTTVDNPAIYSNYKVENGIATGKNVAGPVSGIYTLTLETFATGLTTVTETSTPVDIVLVLDTSSSMTEDYTYKDDDGNSVTDTRLNALKYAVKKFVTEIARNDREKDNGDARDKVLGNRIQIITFNSSATARFSSFQPASANESTIKTNVDNIGYDRGTRTDLGMQTALTWVNTSKNATYWTTNNLKNDNNHNIVVVMFTDGCPSTSGSTNFTASYAIDAVNYAKSIKDAGATVFSVGLITWSDLSTANQTRVRNMMDYISSNFPDGTASSTNTFTCTGTRVSTDYYADANEVDLGDIFQSIAEASGGSASSIPGETMVVDEVSNSFEVPSTFTADDVVVYTRDVLTDGTDWDEESKNILNTIELPADYDLEALPPESIAAQLADEGTVGVYLHEGKLMIIGFNYSKPDSEGANGTTAHPYDGNWVGWRDNGVTCAGKELVIEFKVKASDGVTGGDGTNTNIAATSGVYVPTFDENGNFIGYQNKNSYPYPQTDLPINIIIQKEGLRRGESATIQIYRAPIKEGEFDQNTGKPAPDLTGGWENFTKVILTNTTDTDGATVIKVLRCLDPSFVYRLKEDDWGWGYILDTKDTNTSVQEHNPFIFQNTLKQGAVKHAEAVSVNIFGENYETKSYKSSKVQSFD